MGSVGTAANPERRAGGGTSSLLGIRKQFSAWPMAFIRRSIHSDRSAMGRLCENPVQKTFIQPAWSHERIESNRRSPARDCDRRRTFEACVGRSLPAGGGRVEGQSRYRDHESGRSPCVLPDALDASVGGRMAATAFFGGQWETDRGANYSPRSEQALHPQIRL